MRTKAHVGGQAPDQAHSRLSTVAACSLHISSPHPGQCLLQEPACVSILLGGVAGVSHCLPLSIRRTQWFASKVSLASAVVLHLPQAPCRLNLLMLWSVALLLPASCSCNCPAGTAHARTSDSHLQHSQRTAPLYGAEACLTVHVFLGLIPCSLAC